MPHLALDFEWTRGLTYETAYLENPDEALWPIPTLPAPAWADRRRYVLQHPAEYGEWTDAGTMSRVRIKDGDKVIVRSQESPGMVDVGNHVIRQSSDRGETVRPLSLRPTLYADFARLDGSVHACLKFANSWGLLFTPAEKGAQETLAQWHRGIREVQSWIFSLDLDNAGRHSVLKNESRYPSQLTMVGVELVHGERPTLVLRPQTLLDGMLMQLAQIASTGAGLRECQNCNTYFETGGDTKRSDAKFCSDRCRNKFHYERRAK